MKSGNRSHQMKPIPNAPVFDPNHRHGSEAVFSSSPMPSKPAGFLCTQMMVNDHDQDHLHVVSGGRRTNSNNTPSYSGRQLQICASPRDVSGIFSPQRQRMLVRDGLSAGGVHS